MLFDIGEYRCKVTIRKQKEHNTPDHILQVLQRDCLHRGVLLLYKEVEEQQGACAQL